MGADSISLVTALIEAGNVDTVYRDVYLARARTLLDPALPLEEFHRIEGERAALAELPLSIGRALEKANWPVVKELSQRAESLKAAVESKGKLVEAARGVYAVADVRLDPFSPGLQPFIRIPTNDLPGLRSRAVEQLTALEQADPPWKDFYAGRRGTFQTRGRVTSQPSDASTGTIAPEDTREAAAQALKAGDMSRLAKLADVLMAPITAPTSTSAHRATAGATPAPATPAPEQTGRDLVVSYSSETLAQARQLGLASRHLESWPELASLRSYAWNPLSDMSGHTEITQVPMPSGLPKDVRGRVEMLMIHPLVNSGGARHLPKLVGEDVLVEDFPDPAEGEQPPKSQLLTTLELPGRRGLSRIVIEEALLKHGARVLEKELGLDPRVFRLVCIPSDVHLRLGKAEGWGQRPFWTHFDGYLVKADGRLQALAGGDVTYGGLYDLVGVGRDYDSDRLLARFAVVHRERMEAW